MADLDKRIRKLKRNLFKALLDKSIHKLTDGEIGLLFELTVDDAVKDMNALKITW